MNNELLKGKTVLEIAHPLTEYAGLVLAGMGATVFLVETADGSKTRDRHPYAQSASPDRRSIPFLARNVGKKSVAFDLAAPEDQRLFSEMAERAAVILEPPDSQFSDVLDNLAPKPPRVRLIDPDGLGTSSIVGFAASGGLSSSGWPHQPPCNAPSWFALDGAGIYAALMASIAMRSSASGGPMSFEIRYRDAAHAAITPWTRVLHSYGLTASGQGVISKRTGSGPHPIFRCRDGFVRVLSGTPRQWTAWLELLGNPESLSAPEWEDRPFRLEHIDTMVAVATDLVAGRTMADLFLKGQALGLTITPVFDLKTFMADPHVRSREFFVAIDDPDLGPVELPRPPFREGFPDGAGHALIPAPALDEHRQEAETFARTSLPAPKTPQAGNQIAAPLAGIRVLDCGVGAVVPEAASLLALLGADVIKIESRKHLDFLRRVGLGGVGDFNNSATFNQLNLGVRSLAVDMKTAEGRDLVHKLVAKCDIVLEDLRGPVMGNWGLDYETVRRLRPDVIYLSSQGLGSGEYDGFQTYGPNLQAFSGATSLWAHPDDPYPVGTTLNHPDHMAGKQSLTLIIAALARRDRTGEGCYLDCAQFETPSYMLSDKFLELQVLQEPPQPMGNRSLDFAPHGCYQTAGEDRWCALAVEDDEQWRRFAESAGEGWGNRPEFAIAVGRLARTRELDLLVSAWTATRSAEEIVEGARRAGVPASIVVNGDDLAGDAARHHDGMFQCVSHPTAGTRWYAGLPVTTERGRFAVKRPPLLGEHDEAVLSGLLGLSRIEISRLTEKGVVGYQPLPCHARTDQYVPPSLPWSQEYVRSGCTMMSARFVAARMAASGISPVGRSPGS